MRALGGIAFVCSWPVVSSAECLVANSMAAIPQASFVVPLTATQQGKSAQGAVVELFQKPRMFQVVSSRATDKKGTAMRTEPLAGTYLVEVTSAPGRVSSPVFAVPKGALNPHHDSSVEFNGWGILSTSSSDFGRC